MKRLKSGNQEREDVETKESGEVMCYKCRYPDHYDRPNHTANYLAVMSLVVIAGCLFYGAICALERLVP